MNLEDIGNIGELVGAIGVILTLIYLAAQIRQNTKALKATSHQETTREASDFTAQIAGDEEVARLFDTGSRDWDGLGAVERLRFSMLMFRLFFNFQNLYALHESAGIDDEYWQSQQRVMIWFMSLPGVVRWWSVGKGRLRSSFVAFVEREIIGQAGVAQGVW